MSGTQGVYVAGILAVYVYGGVPFVGFMVMSLHCPCVVSASEFVDSDG